MQIKTIENRFEQKIWNEIANHPLQSWQWGEARKKMGIEVLRLEDEKNVYQLTFHKIPYTNYKIGYLPRSKFPSKAVLEFLFDYGQKNNIIFIKIEPYELKSEIRNPKSEISSKFKIQKSKHPLFPAWTQILDITKSEEDLLKSLHSKTRYNLRLAQKKGVAVKEMSTDEGFEIFAKLYFETCKRQKYLGHNYKYHKTVWENLKNKVSHILIAYYQNIPLAAFQLFYFKDTLYYVYGGTSELHRNLMASNLLMWETIRLGQKLGAKKLDMWGSLPSDYKQGHPWAGFTRFKQGYGGKFVEFVGSYDLIVNPIAYKIYNSLFKIRSIYLQFRR